MITECNGDLFAYLLVGLRDIPEAEMVIYLETY